MSKEQELAIIDESGAVELRVGRAPSTILAEAAMVSKALAKYAHEHQLYKQVGQSKHLMVEGWQMVANMYRVSTRLKDDRYLDFGNGVHGFEATAEAVYIPTQQVVGSATAMCLSDEENWGLRPKYEWRGPQNKRERVKVGDIATPLQQLRSMAQTRAQSKVLASLFKWVAKIGGFAGATAEEIDGAEPIPGAGENEYSHQTQKPQKKEPNQENPEAITEAQGKRLYAIAKQSGFDDDRYREFLKSFGYAKTSDVLKRDYDRMVSDAQKGDAQ